MANTNTLKARKKLKGITKKLGLKQTCPKGQILRAPYKREFKNNVKESGFNVHRGSKTVRVYPKASSAIVKASCVKNRALPGKTQKLIGPLKKGELTKYGYNAHLNREKRHAALKKAIAAYGALDVYHKLDAITKLTLHTAPDAHKVFETDRKWVQTNYTLKKA
jgi:hypothetical protein